MSDITTANHIVVDLDFVTDGIEELPKFLQSKPNYAKLVEWSCNRWSTLDGECIKLAYLRLLDNAGGEVLDVLGERVGLSRNNQIDIEYRALIKFRALRQITGDSRDDIVTLMRTLFYGDNPIISKRSHNFVEVVIPENCLSDADAASQLESMFPINTNLWVTQTDGIAFYLVDGKDDIQPDNTGGLSDSKESTVESLLTEWVHSSGRTIKNTI